MGDGGSPSPYDSRMRPTDLHRPALLLCTVIAAAIAVLSLIPVAELPGPAQPQSTRAALNQHMLAYAVLVFPALATRPAAALWLLPAAVAYGAAIELLQPLVGRERSAADMLANAIGAGIGAVLGTTVHALVARRGR